MDLGSLYDAIRGVVGSPRNGHALALTTTSITDDVQIGKGRMARLFAVIPTTKSGIVRFRFSPDFLVDPEFDNYRQVWAEVAGVLDVEGAWLNPLGPWMEFGSSGKITLNKTSPISGLRDVKITGEGQNIGTGRGFDTWTAGVPDGWAETDVGDGTVVEEATIKKAGAKSAKFNGGTTGAGTYVLRQVTVVAEQVFTVAGWLYGDGASGVAVTVTDTVSGQYLTSAGAWQVGAADCATQTAAAWVRFAVKFTAKIGATTVTVKVRVVANAGVGYADEFSLSKTIASMRQYTALKLEAAKAYTFNFRHVEQDVSSSIKYCIRAPDGDYLQSGGTWSSTEYWFSVAPATTATQVVKTFTSDLEGLYTVWIADEALGATYAQLDQVYLAEVALSTDAVLPAIGTGTATVPSTPVEPMHLLAPYDGRVSAIVSADTATMSVAEI